MSIIYYDLKYNETGKMFTDCLLFPPWVCSKDCLIDVLSFGGRRDNNFSNSVTVLSHHGP